MTFEIEKMLDETGWRLLEALQEHARLSYSELGQRVNLSAPAVAERMRRLEEAGIISGYHAEVNLSKLGLSITAIVRVGNTAGQSCQQTLAHIKAIPEVLECYRVTGSDAVIARVAATDASHLERIIDQVGFYGPSTTSLVLSNSMARRTVTPVLRERGAEEVEGVLTS
ncbi:MAG TPA: Lrp/AsnC family transcriptional regulator [Ktedonobacteraceae bacterium]|jgi:Lrp/AsnC family leucine-responsive transcriptional regulator